jgi:hypothetical protein
MGLGIKVDLYTGNAGHGSLGLAIEDLDIFYPNDSA